MESFVLTSLINDTIKYVRNISQQLSISSSDGLSLSFDMFFFNCPLKSRIWFKDDGRVCALASPIIITALWPVDVLIAGEIGSKSIPAVSPSIKHKSGERSIFTRRNASDRWIYAINFLWNDDDR